MIFQRICFMTRIKFTWVQQNTFHQYSTIRSYSNLKNPSEEMVTILKTKFPLAKSVEVIDVSGGCGAMYEVLVESNEFKGMPIIKQHRLINEILKEQIKEMHGLRIHTVIPKDDENT